MIKIIVTSGFMILFLTYYHFAAFSKDTPDATVDKVTDALEKIRNNGELSRTNGKYHLKLNVRLSIKIQADACKKYLFYFQWAVDFMNNRILKFKPENI